MKMSSHEFGLIKEMIAEIACLHNALLGSEVKFCALSISREPYSFKNQDFLSNFEK